jgi:glyoxylase-like metal-dependent hydrolase (beta-lactamase superfamily II)
VNLRDLTYFITLADERNFGRAAERAFCNQPTLSGQIKWCTGFRQPNCRYQADHVTAPSDLRDATGCATLIGEFTRVECVTQRPREDDIIDVDGMRLRALYTPGHTDESLSFVLGPAQPRAVFTGDVLLIRGTGRTDFQNGDPGKSWDSIVNKLFRLPDDTLVCPCRS